MAKQVVQIGNTGKDLVDILENNFDELYASKDALGDSSTKDVGTTAGTVAAGDDQRFKHQFIFGGPTVLSGFYQEIPTGVWTKVKWPAIQPASVTDWTLDGNGEKFIIPDTNASRGVWICSATVAWQDVISGTSTTLGDHRRKIRMLQSITDPPGSFLGDITGSEDERHFVASCVKSEVGENKVMCMTTYLQAGFTNAETGHRLWVEVWQNSGSTVRIVQHGGQGQGLKIAAPLFMSARSGDMK